MQTSFSVAYNVTDYSIATIDQTYRNIIPQGNYFYYAIMPNSTSGQPYLKGLVIKLDSMIGDADLVVSFSLPNPQLNEN
jgi:hypothetical protein